MRCDTSAHDIFSICSAYALPQPDQDIRIPAMHCRAPMQYYDLSLAVSGTGTVADLVQHIEQQVQVGLVECSYLQRLEGNTYALAPFIEGWPARVAAARHNVASQN